jgi:hypothetical protein
MEQIAGHGSERRFTLVNSNIYDLQGPAANQTSIGSTGIRSMQDCFEELQLGIMSFH